MGYLIAFHCDSTPDGRGPKGESSSVKVSYPHSMHGFILQISLEHLLWAYGHWVNEADVDPDFRDHSLGWGQASHRNSWYTMATVMAERLGDLGTDQKI